MGRIIISRRRFLTSSALCFGGMLVAGCDKLSQSASFRRKLDGAEALSMRGQRLLIGGQSLAREFAAGDISPTFRSNGTSNPADEAYQQLLRDQFATWRLLVDGEVERPASYGLEELRGLPSRTQITRHDCVEGWSAIGRWQGVPLFLLLQAAGLKADARYVVFHCADTYGGKAHKGGDERAGRYYESIDLIDAFHPQTILAYSLNGQPLPVGNGAPLRLRVERQLGYKQAKYVMRVEVTSRIDQIGDGKGGFWEDRGYEWYAGI
jgi:DMSO/TMAO reductase YedYZ molybdopterin-dependent catalytic subunit